MATRIALTTVLVAAGATIAHLAPTPEPPYKMVAELMTFPAPFEGDRLRVHGFVVAGSIVRLGPTTREFEIQMQGRKLRVRHEGLVPDVFHDQTELVELGTLLDTDDGWLLDGDQMSAKCGGKYDGTPVRVDTKFQ